MLQQLAGSTELDGFDPRGYSSWRHPFRICTIYMHQGAAATLDEQVRRACSEETPAEVGGVLLGRVLTAEQEPKVVITDVKFLDSTTRLFNTSAADRPRLATAINEPLTDEDLKPIGCFRSDVRDSPRLSVHDRKFMEENFSDPEAIFLMLKPGDLGVRVGGFFFWQDGQIQADFNDLNIPLISGQPVPGHGAIGLEELPLSSTPAAAAEPQEVDQHGAVVKSELVREHLRDRANSAFTASLRGSHPLFNARKLMAGGILLLAIGVATYLVQSSVHPVHPNPVTPSFTTEVGLRVQTSPGGRLDLSWNRNLPQSLAAQRGKLTILDGSLHREIEISSSLLRFGKLTYIPSGTDVQVEFQVFLPSNRSISESTRVTLPPSQNGTAKAALAANAGRTARSETRKMQANAVLMPSKRPQPSPAVQYRADVAPPTGKQRDSRTDQVRDRSVQEVAASRPVASPPVVAHAAPLNTQPEESARPATTTGRNQGIIAAQSSSSGPSNAAPAQSSAPEQGRAVQQPQSQAPGPVESPAHASSKSEPVAAAVPPQTTQMQTRSASVYIPPAVVREVRPAVPPGVHGLITTEQLVEIRVDLDSAGKVTGARLVGSKGAVAGLLARSALDSIHEYRFRPARRDGVAVASTFTVTFRFVP